MEKIYSIKEILIAVSELQAEKKISRIIIEKKQSSEKKDSEIPKNILKLIEEAEEIKNK
jgi:hypothetical protein